MAPMEPIWFHSRERERMELSSSSSSAMAAAPFDVIQLPLKVRDLLPLDGFAALSFATNSFIESSPRNLSWIWTSSEPVRVDGSELRVVSSAT